MSKLIYYLALGTMLSAVGVILYASYLFFWPSKHFEIKPPTGEVTKQQFYQGENLTYLFNYCAYEDVDIHTVRQFINIDTKQVTAIAPLDARALKQCRQVVSSSAIIPNTIAPGRYKLLVFIKYESNTLREITLTFETEEFEVATPLGEIK